jgi:hypothetical protein
MCLVREQILLFFVFGLELESPRHGHVLSPSISPCLTRLDLQEHTTSWDIWQEMQEDCKMEKRREGALCIYQRACMRGCVVVNFVSNFFFISHC